MAFRLRHVKSTYFIFFVSLCLSLYHTLSLYHFACLCLSLYLTFIIFVVGQTKRPTPADELPVIKKTSGILVALGCLVLVGLVGAAIAAGVFFMGAY